MKNLFENADREIFNLIKDLIKSLRLFQSESVFCENVTFTQFCILDYIVSTNGRLGMSALHPLLGVEKSTTTRLAAPLVKQQLVERVKCETDSRAVDLQITDEGKRIHNNVWECLCGFIGECNGKIPEKEREGVLKAVWMFIQSLENCCQDGDKYCCNIGSV